jgi:hypothetical protein
LQLKAHTGDDARQIPSVGFKRVCAAGFSRDSTILTDWRHSEKISVVARDTYGQEAELSVPETLRGAVADELQLCRS